MKAERIKDMDGFTGAATLYRLDPPLKKHRYVVVSATRVMGIPEALIFPATKFGKIKSFRELPGSRRGTLSHALVLRDAGYTVSA